MDRFAIDEHLGSSSADSDSTSTFSEEDDTTSTSSSFSSSSSSSRSRDQHDDGKASKLALYSMSDLMEQLPIKKGLSTHFQGKSQSFTSLSNARCLEDLAKPQSKLSVFYRNRLKPAKSCSRIISKKASLRHHHHHHHLHGFCSSRGPTHPQSSGDLSPPLNFCN